MALKMERNNEIEARLTMDFLTSPLNTGRIQLVVLTTLPLNVVQKSKI